MIPQTVVVSTVDFTHAQYELCLAHYVLGQEIAFSFNLPIGLTKFFGEIKAEFEVIADQFKVGLKDVVKAFSQRDVFAVLKAVGFNMKLVWKAITTFTALAPRGLTQVFKSIESSGWLTKIQQKTATVDDLLNKYPLLKKLAGLALAGFLLWVWMSMSFTGNPQFDFDIHTVILALKGQYSITELFASPDGLTMLTLLATGVFTGIGFQWLASGVGNLLVALVYTGASKIGLSKLASSAVEKAMHPKKV